MEDHSEAFPRQDPVIVRPGLRLVALVLCAAFISLASMVFPSLVMSEVALIAVAVFALADWLVSRRDPKPQLERLLPARFVKGKAATMVYRLTRPCAPPTIVSMLDELPAELGGVLEFENINLGPSQRCELAREVMPRARGRYEVGPTYISWRSRLGLLQFCARALGGGRVAILPAAAMRRTGLTQRSLREELGLRPRTPGADDGSPVSDGAPPYGFRRGRYRASDGRPRRCGLQARSRARLRSGARARVEGVRRPRRICRFRS